jgi:hypothetical protein
MEMFVLAWTIAGSGKAGCLMKWHFIRQFRSDIFKLSV